MKTQMENTSIELHDELVTEIDDLRHSTTSRSQWLRDAARVRLALEDAGEWPPASLDVDLEEDDSSRTV